MTTPPRELSPEQTERETRRGLRLAQLTVAYNVLEGLVAVGAGLAAGLVGLRLSARLRNGDADEAKERRRRRLAAVAVALMALGVAGHRDGALGFLGVVLAVLALASPVVPTWSTTRLAGDAVWQPSSAVVAERCWSLGADSAVLDLTRLGEVPPRRDPLHVPVRVGLGELRVEVPEGADVVVRGQVLVGRVEHLRNGTTVSRTEGGVGVDRTVVTGGSGADVLVDARTLIGDVTVVEVAR